MSPTNINAKKITLIALAISIIDIIMLAFAENWYKPTYIRRLFENGLIHILFILIIIFLFYYSAKADKKLKFTKYILSGALLFLLIIYNLGAINIIFLSDTPYSIGKDAPYSIIVLLWM